MINKTKKAQKEAFNEIFNGYHTATKKANAKLKNKILAEMEENRGYTISEIVKELECCVEPSNQKVLAVVKQLVKSNLVVKIEDKEKTYFLKA